MGPLGKALGMSKKPMLGDDEEEGEDYTASPSLDEEPMAEEPASDVPPDFQAAYDEYTETPSASSMYAMIEACKGGAEAKSPGLALILGGKGKKP